MIANIEVSDSGIIIEIFDGRVHTTRVFGKASIEALEDAAVIVAEAMELPAEDFGRHLQLIAQRDQVNAMLHDMVTTFTDKN